MSPRGRHHGVRKVCGCGRSRWPKCSHAWYFSYKPRGGQRWRFSLDAELAKHFENLTDAQKAATDIRAAIHAGTFRRMNGAPATAPATTSVTLDQFATTYIERAAKASGKRTWREDEHRLALLREHRRSDGQRLGDVPVTAITEDELEAFLSAQRTAGRAASTLNHLVQTVKAAFRWAAKKGYIQRSLVSEDSALKRTKVAQRRRRISADEESALLKAAGALDQRVGFRLSGLIVAAMEAGCRVGELLALQWADLDLVKRTVFVRATEQGARKTGRSRLLPMSGRLASVLEMARTDPAGREYTASTYAFGFFGERVRNINKAWKTCVLRAYGHAPKWANGGKLSSESRAALRTIDLHFHDLRHEAGCRWLEAGVPIHVVQQWLGHTNLAQTSTYLHADEMGSQEWMKRFDAARDESSSDASTDSRGKTVANEPAIEHRPLGHGKQKPSEKGLLH